MDTFRWCGGVLYGLMWTLTRGEAQVSFLCPAYLYVHLWPANVWHCATQTYCKKCVRSSLADINLKYVGTGRWLSARRPSMLKGKRCSEFVSGSRIHFQHWRAAGGHEAQGKHNVARKYFRLILARVVRHKSSPYTFDGRSLALQLFSWRLNSVARLAQAWHVSLRCQQPSLVNMSVAPTESLSAPSCPVQKGHGVQGQYLPLVNVHINPYNNPPHHRKVSISYTIVVWVIGLLLFWLKKIKIFKLL